MFLFVSSWSVTIHRFNHNEADKGEMTFWKQKRNFYSPTFVTSLADGSTRFIRSLWLNLDQMLAEYTKQARTALYLYFVTYELPALISPSTV